MRVGAKVEGRVVDYGGCVSVNCQKGSGEGPVRKRKIGWGGFVVQTEVED